MSAAEFQTLNHSTLIIAFMLATAFGAVARWARFCTMGAISDVLHLGDWGRMHQWATAVGVAMLGFTALVVSGQIDPAQTLYASTQVLWLSALVGGVLFGAGMVLASGCGSRNLIRLGGGSLKSLVVLIVMGLAAFATLKGITAVLRVTTVDTVHWQLGGQAFLPDVVARWWQTPVPPMRMGLGVAFATGLLLWALWRRPGRHAAGLIGGAVVGAVVVGVWWLSGHYAEVLEHPETLEHVFAATNSGRIEALSFVTPVAFTLDWLLFFSDRNKVLSIGVVSVLGVVVGAALQALWSREFRWQGFANTQDLAYHLVGAVMMGVGGVTAMGCTIGQGVSALSTLHLASFVAVAGIVGGAVAALRYQMWSIDRCR